MIRDRGRFVIENETMIHTNFEEVQFNSAATQQDACPPSAISVSLWRNLGVSLMAVRKCKCVQNGSQPTFSSSPTPHTPQKAQMWIVDRNKVSYWYIFFAIKKHQRKGTRCPKGIFGHFCTVNRVMA